MSRERVTVTRSFDCDARDLLVAANAVIAERFGTDAVQGTRRRWFSRRSNLTYQSIKVGCDQAAQVVLSGFEVRGFPGRLWLDAENVFMGADLPKEQRAAAEDLMAAVHERLKVRSLYRGKALTAMMEFMDLSAIEVEGLTYNSELERELKAHVWTLIEQREACLDAGIKLQRKVLFAGPFGSGKTLSALLTAKKAIEHGWTFVYLDPSYSATRAVPMTLEFARKYQPAVVLVEDFDREQRESNPFALGHLMASIDGAMSKSNELLVILTTNYPDKISAGLQRPGRIDRVIDFGRFEPQDVSRLLQRTIPSSLLDPSIDWDAVGRACEGYTPAFVHEVGNSAKLAAISEGGRPVVTQRILVKAANALNRQHKVCTQESLGFRTQE